MGGAGTGARAWTPAGTTPSDADSSRGSAPGLATRTPGATGAGTQGTDTRSASGAALATGATAAGAIATGAPATGAPATGAATTGSDPAADDAETPDWRSLLKAMAPPPGPAQESAETGSIPVVEAMAVSGGAADELPERIRRPLPFTWLQWIILIVVFFVLGFLIVLVAKTATGATGDITPTVALATSWLPPTPL